MVESMVNIASAIIPLLIVLIGLALAVAVDPYISRRHRRVMLIIVALAVCAVLQESLEYLMKAQIVNPLARTWNSIFGYSVRPVILLLFIDIVGFKRRAWPVWTLVIVNALIHLTALFTGRICFGFSGNNFYRGTLGYTSHVVSGILLAILLIRTVREYDRARRSETWILIGNALLVVVAVALDSVVFTQLEMPASLCTISVVCSTLFYYIWLHLQFVREHEQVLMAGQRVQLALSQIKPHFLYNALGTIEALCDSNPSMAKLATGKFSEYLRGNMDAIDRMNAIPFIRELEHTKLYLEIEQLRFRDALTIRYDIACTGFSVPALTLETLVENAVRHGVRKNERGIGTVTIATREAGDHYEISVTDDGPGFDPSELPDDGRTHVGIKNARDRLRSVCGGSLEIVSAPGKGTTATIIIPKAQ